MSHTSQSASVRAIFVLWLLRGYTPEIVSILISYRRHIAPPLQTISDHPCTFVALIQPAWSICRTRNRTRRSCIPHGRNRMTFRFPGHQVVRTFALNNNLSGWNQCRQRKEYSKADLRSMSPLHPGVAQQCRQTDNGVFSTLLHWVVGQLGRKFCNSLLRQAWVCLQPCENIQRVSSTVVVVKNKLFTIGYLAYSDFK